MKTNQSLWSCACAVALFASVALAAGEAAPQARKPNILVILTDQQQAAMMSCAGNAWVRTPNLDRLAAGGVRFEKAYCANPVCIPSRFSLFTGTLPSAIGMDDNRDVKNPVATNILAQAMGTIFRSAGYQTVYAGKVHLPGQPGVCDNVAAYGFEERLAPRDPEGRDPTVDACVKFLTAPQSKPFLLVASLINPHDICYLPLRDYENALPPSKRNPGQLGPLPLAEVDAARRLPPGISEPEFYSRLCPALPENYAVPEQELTAYMAVHGNNYLGWTRRTYTDKQWLMYRWVYARLTERVDAQIGRVLEALRSAGLEDNTLVVFTSDHGEQNGAHHATTKGTLYEESVRIPFLLSWKGVITPGRVDAASLVSNGLDLIPTLCDFAGVPAPAALKGRSVRPLAEGRPAKDWRSCLVVENNSSRLVLSSNWKYMVGHPDTLTPAVLERLSAKQPVREALVDLTADAGELHNRAFDPACRAQLLEGRRLLKAWYAAHDLKLDPAYIVED